MENILPECQTGSVDVLYLTYLQLIILTVLNLLISAGTVISNSLVIFLLIKTKQIFKVSCKLIFHLSISDLSITLLVQNLFLAVLFETDCIVKIASQFLSGFLVRLSAYTTGLTGIDRFIRIKYKITFRSILTSKSVMFMLLLVWFFALTNATMLTIGALVKGKVFGMIALVLDIAALSFVIIMQLLTIKAIRRVNRRNGQTSSKVTQQTHDRITSMCSKIMLLFVIFMGPYIIMCIVRSKIRKSLNSSGKSLLEFVFRLSILLGYSNSFVNAVFFLTKNVKCRRFLKKTIEKIRASSKVSTETEIEVNITANGNKTRATVNLPDESIS